MSEIRAEYILENSSGIVGAYGLFVAALAESCMDSLRVDRRGSIRRGLALLCVVAVAMVTTAAAAHVCELAGLCGRQFKTSVVVGPDHGPCLICVGAHSPGLAALASPFSPSLTIAAAEPGRPVGAPQSFQGLPRHIRPPPSK